MMKKNKIYIYDEYFYSEYDCFYMDIIKNKDLGPIAFFGYIYKKYRSFNNVEIILNKMYENGNKYKADILKIIFDYKEACLYKNRDKIGELKQKFDSISNKLNFKLPSKSPVDKQPKTSTNFIEPIDVINEIDEYLISNHTYTKSQINKIKSHMFTYKKYIDIEKYADIIIKNRNINKISQKELDEIIEILKYFIYHLNDTLEKLQEYKNNMLSINKKMKNCYQKIVNIKENKNKTIKSKSKLEIFTYEYKELEKLLEIYRKKLDSIYIEGEEELNQKKYGYVTVLCNWKIIKVKGSIKAYDKLLKDIIGFSDALNSNKDKLIEINPSTINVDEDYLINIIKHIKSIISGYRQIPVKHLTEEETEKMKTYYIEKLYKN